MINDYFTQALKLLPKGLIWGWAAAGRLAATLWMAARQLAGAQRRAENLINEAIPQTAVELLAEWEAFAGLPDECTAGTDMSIAERQDAVVEKLTGLGSLSVASFYALAQKLGYEITIREYRPFICGRSVCGGPDQLGQGADGALTGPHSTGSGNSAGASSEPGGYVEDGYNARLYWRVTVHGPRAHWFRAGRNTAGERLGWYSPARDLECFFKRRQPAHTIIIFDYQEAL